MKVLLLTSNFVPEISAVSRIMSEICEDLIEKGHEVVVMTEFPCHPTGAIPRRYRFKLYSIEDYKGAKVIRTFVVASTRNNYFHRLVNYLSFFVSSLLGLFLVGKIDVVFAISPQLTIGATACVFSAVKKVPFVISIQDIYPDVLISLAEFKNKYVIGILKWLERLIYRKASKICVISDGFRKNLVSKGVEERKIIIIPNWVDTNFIMPMDKSNSFSREHEIDDKFVVLFAGTIGLSQGLEFVIDAAKLLVDNKDIVFVIVGEGMDKDHFLHEAEHYSMRNLKILPIQPRDKMPEILASSDASIVSLKKDKVPSTIPCKIYEIMASKRAIIAAVDKHGDCWKIIENANSGVWVEQGNSVMFKDVVLRLYDDISLRNSLAENGYKYMRTHSTRKQGTSKYIVVIENQVKS